MSTSGRWARLIFQGLGVTVSILLAFSVDAWWDYRQERIMEQRALARLRTEFETNRQRLVAARASHQGILDKAIQLLDHIDSLRTDPNHEVPDSLLAALWNWQTYDPLNGTLNSLIASGQLGLVENDTLRAALARWPDMVADLNEDEANQRDVVRDHVIPFLARNASFRTLLRAKMTEFGLEQRPPDRAGLVQVLLDRELENWLIDRIEGKTALLGSEGELDSVFQLLDQIQGLLSKEIETSGGRPPPTPARPPDRGPDA